MDPASLMLIAHIVDALLLGVEMAPAVFDHLSKLSADIKAMVEQGRDPNAGEWMDMESRLRAEIAKLQASGQQDSPAPDGIDAEPAQRRARSRPGRASVEKKTP
jgi:hypothetical protein